MENNTISLKELFKAITKRKVLVIVTVLVFTAAFAGVSLKTEEPTYTAQSKVFFGKDLSKSSAYNKDDLTLYQGILNNYVAIMQTTDFVQGAIDKAGLDISAKDASKSLKVAAVEKTQIVSLSYTGKSENEAKDLLNGVVSQLKESTKTLMPVENLNVIQHVEITENISEKNTIVFAVMGFVLGLILSILLALMLEFMKVRK